MKKIKLNVVGLTTTSISTQNSYALILADEETGKKRLPIVIGPFEAQAISIALENLTPPRPLTHDLLVAVITQLKGQVKEVIINNLKKGVFYSLIVIQQGDKEITIDSRTSDAIALALRVKCPINIYAHIFEENSIDMDELQKTTKKSEPNEVGSLDIIEDQTEEEIVQMLFDWKQKGKKEKIKETLKLIREQKLEPLLNIAIEKELYEVAAFIRDEIKNRKRNK